MDLEEIRRLLRAGHYEVSFHAQQERLEEDLDLAQIEAAIVGHGELLEQYPNDPRGRKLPDTGFCRRAPGARSARVGENGRRNGEKAET